MGIQKKIDKSSTQISKMYLNGIEDIVNTLLKLKKGISDKDFALTLLSQNMNDIVKSKLSKVSNEYTKAHIEVLKAIKPKINND